MSPSLFLLLPVYHSRTFADNINFSLTYLNKVYKTGLLTVEFYRKVKSDKRYKLLSNDFKFGRVGVTILDIMREVQTKTGQNTYGLVAATLLEEASVVSTLK